MAAEQRPVTWRVNLRGRVDEYVARVLDSIQSAIVTLQEQVEALRRSSNSSISASSIRKELQTGGSAPLNVEGLLGKLSQPQTGGAPSRTTNPSLSDPLVQDGALFVLLGAPNQLYRVNGSHSPMTFDSIGGSGSVTSVNGASSASGFTLTGGPFATSGTLTFNVSSAANARTTLGIDALATKKSNLSAAVAPTVNDDSGAGYAIGSTWIDTVADDIYMATDVTVGAALWRKLN